MKTNILYKLIFRISERTLTYTAKILSDEGGFISIEDKFGNIYNYNKNCLISYEVLSNGK